MDGSDSYFWNLDRYWFDSAIHWNTTLLESETSVEAFSNPHAMPMLS